MKALLLNMQTDYMKISKSDSSLFNFLTALQVGHISRPSLYFHKTYSYFQDHDLHDSEAEKEHWR